jgi:hypothetical protein
MSEMCAQLSREQALEILVGIAQDPQNEPKDRVHALQVYAEISDGDAPRKLELGVDSFVKWYFNRVARLSRQDGVAIPLQSPAMSLKTDELGIPSSLAMARPVWPFARSLATSSR